MRQKKEAVLSFASNDEGLPKVLRDYRARYRMISQVLDGIRRSWMQSIKTSSLFRRAVGKAAKATSPQRTSCGH